MSEQYGQTIQKTQSSIFQTHWYPKEYQKRAIKMLLSQAAVGLFLDPGLGKTSIVLAGLKILLEKKLINHALIIAPLRVIYSVWPSEIKKWADFNGLTYSILHGPDKERNLRTGADIYLINPEGLLWLYDVRRATPTFDVLVVDESTKFKDSTTRRFKLLKPHLPTFSRRWILTGTPAPNGLIDLFGQMYILDLGRALGRYITHFRNRYMERAGFNMYDWRPRYGAFEEIIEEIKPLILQLSAEDYLQMPELISTYKEVTLPPEAAKMYTELEDYFITQLQDDKLVAANAAVAGGKCRQIANGAVYDSDKVWHPIHDEKLEALEELLEELSGKPALVLYEFNHDRERILNRFGAVPVLGSGTSPKQIEDIIGRFNAGEIPVLLGHPGSMGHGLNLQGACHHIIWFGITWNLEFYDQAIARVYRQGQKEARVFVHHLVAKDTLDEKVVRVLDQKDKTQQSLLEALSEY